VVQKHGKGKPAGKKRIRKKRFVPMKDDLAKLEQAKEEYLLRNGGNRNKTPGFGPGRGKRGKAGYQHIANKFGISATTLRRFVAFGLSKKIGRPSALDPEEERMLSSLLKIRASWGFALSLSKLSRCVEEYMTKRFERELELFEEGRASSRNPPKPYFSSSRPQKYGRTHRPGRWWLRSFILRHQDLSVRLAENRRMAYSAITKELIIE
jgi:hypothetical protein